MYLQGQKKSPIGGKSLGLGFFSLRESFLSLVRPRNENFLLRKRNLGRELFHLWLTCFRPYRTFILGLRCDHQVLEELETKNLSNFSIFDEI